MKARFVALLIALLVLLALPAASTIRVVQPPPDWRPLLRQAFASLLALSRYHYTRIERDARGQVDTQIEGDWVGPDGVSVYGVYQGVPIATVIRGATSYEAQAGAWVRRPVTNAIRSWFAPSAPPTLAGASSSWLRHPLARLPASAFGLVAGGYAPSARIADLGETVLDGRRLHQLEFRDMDSTTMTIDMPLYAVFAVWLAPGTAQIYKYSWVGAGSAGAVTITRQGDSTLVLPVPQEQ